MSALRPLARLLPHSPPVFIKVAASTLILLLLFPLSKPGKQPVKRTATRCRRAPSKALKMRSRQFWQHIQAQRHRPQRRPQEPWYRASPARQERLAHHQSPAPLHRRLAPPKILPIPLQVHQRARHIRATPLADRPWTSPIRLPRKKRGAC